MKRLLSIILVMTLVLTLFTSCEGADRALASTYLNLGEKYLTDLNYEEAIVYFNKLIEVDPKNERAYLGMAEAYVALGDTDSAIAILEQGIEVVDDPTELQAMLAELLGESEDEEQDEVIADEVAANEDTTPEETVGDEETEEPVFVTTAMDYYSSDGSYGYKYEYDTEGYVVRLSAYSSNGGEVSMSDTYGYINTYENSTAWNEYEYDLNKKLIGWTSYNSNNDSAVSSGEFTCDYNGNIVSWVDHDTSGEENIYANYEYNFDNQLIRSSTYNSDGYTVLEYNSIGRVTNSYTYDSNGDLDYWFEMEYDSNGNETKYVKYSSDGSVSYWWEYEYEYDSDGNRTKYVWYNSNGSILSWDEYEYDTSGNRTKEVWYNSDGSGIRAVYEYTYEYGTDGEIVSRTITGYGDDGSVCTIEYQTRIN